MKSGRKYDFVAKTEFRYELTYGLNSQSLIS